MDSENEICLWCQDSLSGQGPVIELTTDVFKLMFKHDASCKIIHWACFQDYQQKRANELTNNEQMQANDQSDYLDQRAGLLTSGIEPTHWMRILFQYARPSSSQVVGVRRVYSTTTIWPEPSQLCTLNRGRTMVGMEQYHPNSMPSYPRGGAPPPQTFPMQQTQFSRRSLPPPQPLHHPSIGHAQFSRQPPLQPLHHSPTIPAHFSPQPYMPPSFQPRGAPSALTFHNRFAPYPHPQGYYTGAINHVAEPQRHFHVQRNMYPSVYTITCQSSSTGAYTRSVSVITHTHSSRGFE